MWSSASYRVSWNGVTRCQCPTAEPPQNRVHQPGVTKLLVEDDNRYQLTRRERVTFAHIAQTESISATEFAEELAGANPLHPGPVGSSRGDSSSSRGERTQRTPLCRPRSCSRRASTPSRRLRGSAAEASRARP
jgi:hypothetical protein